MSREQTLIIPTETIDGSVQINKSRHRMIIDYAIHKC
jgi:hypothetical protein